MSNNSNTILNMLCIVTFIVCISFLETNTLSTFTQTDNIALDNIMASATSNGTGFNSWGCFKEFGPTDCNDMSNTSSTYLGLVAGAVIGGVISWWVYYRQNKTSRKQDHVLYLIEQIERKNGKILKHLESYAKHHDVVLNKILLLEESIQALNKKIESKEEDPHF
jgi:Na+/glutamate symporter